MKVVFRVQDKEGRGPWRPGFSEQWTEDRPPEDYELLKPWFVEMGRVDLMALPGRHVGCGCTSLSQLRKWFTESEYKTLKGFGYSAVQMIASRVLGKSETQCVFERTLPLNQGVTEVELYKE